MSGSDEGPWIEGDLSPEGRRKLRAMRFGDEYPVIHTLLDALEAAEAAPPVGGGLKFERFVEGGVELREELAAVSPPGDAAREEGRLMDEQIQSLERALAAARASEAEYRAQLETAQRDYVSFAACIDRERAVSTRELDLARSENAQLRAEAEAAKAQVAHYDEVVHLDRLRMLKSGVLAPEIATEKVGAVVRERNELRSTAETLRKKVRVLWGWAENAEHLMSKACPDASMYDTDGGLADQFDELKPDVRAILGPPESRPAEGTEEHGDRGEHAG